MRGRNKDKITSFGSMQYNIIMLIHGEWSECSSMKDSIKPYHNYHVDFKALGDVDTVKSFHMFSSRKVPTVIPNARNVLISGNGSTSESSCYSFERPEGPWRHFVKLPVGLSHPTTFVTTTSTLGNVTKNDSEVLFVVGEIFGARPFSPMCLYPTIKRSSL